MAYRIYTAVKKTSRREVLQIIDCVYVYRLAMYLTIRFVNKLF